MNTLLLNLLVLILALLVLFGVWIGVHLLARHKMGDRKLGCRGPSVDAQGNSICCNSGLECQDSSKNRQESSDLERTGSPR